MRSLTSHSLKLPDFAHARASYPLRILLKANLLQPLLIAVEFRPVMKKATPQQSG